MNPPEPEKDTVKIARYKQKYKNIELEVPKPTNTMARINNTPKSANILII